MLADKNILRFIKDSYYSFKEDKNLTILKLVKAILTLSKNDKIIKFNNQYIVSSLMPPFLSNAMISNFNCIEDKEKNKYTQHYELKRKAPITCYICVTEKCPNNCEYCSCKNLKYIGKELTTVEWINAIKQLQDMGTSVIGITGGEPLIRQDMVDIIKSIDDRSVSTIFTSGINLTYEKALEFKNAGLFSFGISLEIDSIYNNEGKNDRLIYTIKAIENSVNVGIYTCVHIVVSKNQLDEFELFKIFNLLNNLGVNEIRIFEPIYSGNIINSKNKDEILFNDEDRQKLFKIQEKGNKIFKNLKISTDSWSESKHKFGCSAGTIHTYISPVGDLFPCDFFPFSFGNILNNNIQELYINMRNYMKHPKTYCVAQEFNKKFSNEKLPIYNENVDILDSVVSSKEVPKIFKDMRGY
jgi:MoaA/NifB/PqqE/SkfB family radical SAM enzyme